MRTYAQKRLVAPRDRHRMLRVHCCALAFSNGVSDLLHKANYYRHRLIGIAKWHGHRETCFTKFCCGLEEADCIPGNEHHNSGPSLRSRSRSLVSKQCPNSHNPSAM